MKHKGFQNHIYVGTAERWWVKMFAKEGDGGARRYAMKDILMRRVRYATTALRKKDMYDYEQQSLIEYGRCLAQRKGRQIVGTACYRRKLQTAGIKNKFIISRIAVSVTNQCSLRCRDCNNLMPYCKEKYVADVNEQIRNLKKILYYVDGIVNVEVIGGEPFVYAQLPEVLRYLCEEPKVTFVEVTSNGTVLPSQEIQDILKHPKICVCLSDYGKVNSEKLQRTFHELKKNNICVQNMRNRKWILPGGIERRKKSRLRVKYDYFHCAARKDCRTLYKGKLYVCGRAPILDELGLLTNKSSFLDIRNLGTDKKAGRKTIYRFFNNDYAESCEYCDCSSDYSYWIESGIQVQR